MFLWLGVALIIDGIDGTFARRLRVAEVLPRWSGDVLDLVVDVMNYVFVPAYALAASGLLPASLAAPLGLLIVITASLYFADRWMKTADYYFRGFPAVWNVAAFYMFMLKPPPWLGAFLIVALAALTFVPVHFVHPVRIAHLRALDHGRADSVGVARVRSPWRRISIPEFGCSGNSVHSGNLLCRHRVFAPASSVTALRMHPRS